MNDSKRKHTLNIQLKAAEGAVLRALGLIERRGFRLETVHAAEPQGTGQALVVTVIGDRPADLLRRQLERLYDVLWVELPEAAAPANWTAHGTTNASRSGAAARPAARRN